MCAVHRGSLDIDGPIASLLVRVDSVVSPSLRVIRGARCNPIAHHHTTLVVQHQVAGQIGTGSHGSRSLSNISAAVSSIASIRKHLVIVEDCVRGVICLRTTHALQGSSRRRSHRVRLDGRCLQHLWRMGMLEGHSMACAVECQGQCLRGRLTHVGLRPVIDCG